jgi:GT2 family glycosyltransferase
MQNCSVIIVNYNTGDLLKKAVDAAILNKSVYEVIVVDNNSSDGSMDLLKESDQLKKYFRNKNYGFASSCNFAANLSSSRILVFLNPDCIVNQDSIDSLISVIKNKKNAAIIGCHVTNPDGTEQRASRRRLPTFIRALKTLTRIEKLAKICHCFAGVNLNHHSMPKSVITVEAISGALIMMKVNVFIELNGFDDKYPLHFEDLDLFKRTLNEGYDILFEPNVSVIHHQGTSSQSNPRVAQFKKIGIKRYFEKHASKISSLIVNLISR